MFYFELKQNLSSCVLGNNARLDVLVIFSKYIIKYITVGKKITLCFPFDRSATHWGISKNSKSCLQQGCDPDSLAPSGGRAGSRVGRAPGAWVGEDWGILGIFHLAWKGSEDSADVLCTDCSLYSSCVFGGAFPPFKWVTAEMSLSEGPC